MTKVNILTRRKGQLTVFMIVGVLIVVIVFFLFYAVRVSTVRRLEAETRRVASVAISQTAVEYLGEKCLKDSLREGLDILGMQGGWFLEGQPGYLRGQAPSNIGGISYLVYQESYPKGWPCGVNWLEPDYCRYVFPRRGMFFSYSKLPSMEQVKRQLSVYVANKTKECINLTQLLKLAANYEGYAGEVVVKEILFSPSSVSAKVDYPIEISVTGGKPIVFAQYFEEKIEPIRFLQIYRAVEKAVENEVLDLNYDIRAGLEEEISKRLSNVRVTPETKGGDKVLKINDEFSGYLFQFAVKNRPPVLSYIHNHPHPNDGDLYDYLAFEGDYAEIIPKAADPDGDTVLVAPKIILNTSTAGIRTVKVTAMQSDGRYSDEQDVRVLVDHKLLVVINNSNRFDDVDNDYASIEDSYYLNGYVLNETLDPYAAYSYNWYIGDEVFRNTMLMFNPGELEQPGFSVVFKVDLHYTNYSTSHSTRKTIEVKECLPHETHKCCTEEFTFAGTDVVCYTKEDRYCKDKGTLFWVNETPRYCSGTTGKTCEGEWGKVLEPRKTNICGVRGKEGCSNKITTECQEWVAYLVKNINETQGWCYGETGCEKFCEDKWYGDYEVVDANDNGIIDSGDVCGCASEYNGLRCDGDFDGKWEGICNGKDCE